MPRWVWVAKVVLFESVDGALTAVSWRFSHFNCHKTTLAIPEARRDVAKATTTLSAVLMDSKGVLKRESLAHSYYAFGGRRGLHSQPLLAANAELLQENDKKPSFLHIHLRCLTATAHYFPKASP